MNQDSFNLELIHPRINHDSWYESPQFWFVLCAIEIVSRLGIAKSSHFWRLELSSFSILRLSSRAEPKSPISGMLAGFEWPISLTTYWPSNAQFQWKLRKTHKVIGFYVIGHLPNQMLVNFGPIMAILREKWALQGSSVKALKPEPSFGPSLLEPGLGSCKP